LFFIRPRRPAPGEEEPRLVSPATTTMSQRFSVSKSDGDRRLCDIQGEVNQLFEGDEPSACGVAPEEATPADTEDVVVVLKDFCNFLSSPLSCSSLVFCAPVPQSFHKLSLLQ
ncbi:hypothetical protein XENOCAPTIV_011115, partial [Xenoophorus captivus]